MKKCYLLFLIIMSIFIMSCGGHFFNPRYYYTKGEDFVAPPDIGPERPPEEVDPDKDPFEKGDWNSPDYQFPGENFKNWLFKASFQRDKLPIYTFFNDANRSWISGGFDWNNRPANYYNGRDGENTAGSIIGNVAITGLKVYQYVGDNPLYSKEGYLEGRMDRFNFYSINGSASAATLKQYLIAVDTYSKFIFAFGAITGTESIAGDKVPISFEAIEKHADKRPFFEYDPIGYVKEDGTVVLYEHYRKEFVQSPTTYLPKVHAEFTTMAKHTEDGQGNSPYYVLDTSNINPEEILDGLKNNRYGIRDELVLYEYKFDSTAQTLTLSGNDYYSGELETKTYYYSKAVGLTSLEYTNSSSKITITAYDDYKKIKDDVRNEYILNYQDPGVSFKLRVRGRTYYASDNSYYYVFSQDASTVTHYEGGKVKATYTYSSAKDNQTVEYQAGMAAYWGLRVNDYQGIKDGELSWSLGSSPFPGATSALDYHKGYLVKNTTDDFLNDIKGKTYQTRKGLILYSYEFSNDGKTLTYRETDWKGKISEVVKKYQVDEASIGNKKASYSYNGETLEVGIKDDNNTLYKGDSYDILGIYNYNDPGPTFLERVAGETYEGSGYKYEFSYDGKTIKCSNGKTYTYTEQDANDRAIYDDGAFLFHYWGLRLAKYDGKNDGVLYWSMGAGATPGGTQTSGVTSNPAYKK